MPQMPRTRKCYGWIKIASDDLTTRKVRPPMILVDRLKRFLRPGTQYTGIIYEIIEEGGNDKEAMDKTFEFYRLAGFGHTMISRETNWKQSILLDLADLVHPWSYGWRPWKLTTRQVLRSMESSERA
jgi:hypothetical protein